MPNCIKIISGNDLAQYANSTRSCKLQGGYELKGKFGSLKLSFKEIGKISKCTVYACRKSGNGKLTCVSGENTVFSTILARSSEYFSIDVGSDIVEFQRPPDSTGVVKILSVELFFDSPLDDMLQNEKWKNVLARCKNYKCIKLTKGRLFASEGAIIEANVQLVETNPPNFYTIQDGKVKFKGNCEITNIVVSDEVEAKPQQYPHLNAPAKIQPPHPETAHGIKSQPTHFMSVRKKSDNISADDSSYEILYDSTVSGRFSSVHTNDNAVVAPDRMSVKLDHRGNISIPLSSINPNTSYICVVEGYKSLGNGKVNIHIQPTQIDKHHSLVFFTSHQRSHNVIVSTQGTSSSEYKLVIERPPSATGHIVINRILLLHSVAQHEAVRAHANSVATKHYEFKISSDFEITENDMTKVLGEYKMPENSDIKFAIVIPSYNNSKWVDRNLKSTFDQKYSNYRVLFVDDCSKDDTFEKAQQIVKDANQTDRVSLVKNERRKGALHNLYDMIHSCDDNEIVITLDGDDWFAHDGVLDKLHSVYSDNNVWLTYGQYKSYPDNGAGCSTQIPAHITKSSMFRQYRWCSSHLRTFYAWLFKKIKVEDLKDTSGSFYPMAWDLAFQFPMLEMGGLHCVFIPDVLYIYNVENPINDSKVNLKLQQSLEREIRAKPKYDRV